MNDLPYMTDNSDEMINYAEDRKNKYSGNTLQEFRTATPTYRKGEDGEIILFIGEHEVMADFQRPYMNSLAEVVTRNGGDILNIGFGLGIVDDAIEEYRKMRNLQNHVVIEINETLAKTAAKRSQLKVHNVDWESSLKYLDGQQFDGIVYDGFPLTSNDIHLDGVRFIDWLADTRLLKPNGILTFFADTPDQLGESFSTFLIERNFHINESVKIPVSTRL